MKAGDKVIYLYPNLDSLFSNTLNKYAIYTISEYQRYINVIFINEDSTHHTSECFMLLSEYKKMKLLKIREQYMSKLDINIGDKVVYLYPDKDLFYLESLKKHNVYTVKCITSCFIIVYGCHYFHDISSFVKISEYRKMKFNKLHKL